MKLTIIAATGGVGRQLLAQALDAGHDVTLGGPQPRPAARRAGGGMRAADGDRG